MQFGYYFFIVLVFTLGVIIHPIYGEPEDISKITAEKYILRHGDSEFTIYYGYAGSFEIEINKNVQNPKVISMQINEDNKSLEINFEKTLEKSLIWFRLPEEVISADKDDFVLLVDGSEIGYDIVDYQNEIRLGFVLNEGAQKVEIIGTEVIPEFEGMQVLVFSLSVFAMLMLWKKTIHSRLTTQNQNSI